MCVIMCDRLRRTAYAFCYPVIQAQSTPQQSAVAERLVVGMRGEI